MSTQVQQRLLITSGDGPSECRRAVALVLRQIEKEAIQKGLRFDAAVPDPGQKGDPASALVTLTGAEAERLAGTWSGTIQWTCKSPFRPHHKRQNWFVGVFPVSGALPEDIRLKAEDLRVETFRSGGPGGQHQNTTDSGVRIIHLPTGVSAQSTDERSQHRNRQVALDRLEARFLLQREESLARNRADQNRLHRQLERGNPARVFKGERFSEAK
ncbi:peptide chain release factor H [Roseibium sediminicola]|uniref:Peptide chain release factor H n=1 Tax=Roseibium sediminicola TaxID=2933272 RepID=A0ABT0H1A7_9HYPH|nr:peptide chain release factor H [Roseibium sp. CAU 1639]MCK7615472.1 peptide chain release factor H [Roseibium sp. CAU 1639]